MTTMAQPAEEIRGAIEGTETHFTKLPAMPTVPIALALVRLVTVRGIHGKFLSLAALSRGEGARIEAILMVREDRVDFA